MLILFFIEFIHVPEASPGVEKVELLVLDGLLFVLFDNLLLHCNLFLRFVSSIRFFDKGTLVVLLFSCMAGALAS